MLPTAQQQTAVPPEQLLHSGNATVVVERIAQIRSGFGTTAREALREACEYINLKLVGRASAFVYEETFGVRDRLHILLHLASFDDYTALALLGNQLRAGWDELFVAGSVQDLVMQPHRWGMHGSLTEEMVKDPGVSPLGASGAFVVTPAQAQTTVPAEKVLHTANSGVVMRRTADFDHEFRAEARVFDLFDHAARHDLRMLEHLLEIVHPRAGHAALRQGGLQFGTRHLADRRLDEGQ